MYELTLDQESLRKEIRTFVDAEIRPVAAQLDEGGRYPHALVKRIYEKGFGTLPFPSSLGGSGRSLTESMIFLEEISRGCASLGFILNAHMHACCYGLLGLVSEKQKRDWFIPAVTGEKLLAFAITEQRGGSDAFITDTLAERTSDGWLLNGAKCWITNAGAADGYIISAKTGLGNRSRNVSLFYVDARTEGLTVSPVEMIGLKNSPTGNVEFKDCKLPPDALIGQENEGYKPVRTALNLGRLGLAAIAIGLAQSAFEKAVAFACSRGDYGRTIFSYQGVSFPIAEMYTNITMARNSLYHVAAITQAGQNATMETAALKLFASEMCQKVCQDTILIHGGSGFRSHCDAERMLRDAQLLTVAEGTSQICKVAITNRIYSMGSSDKDSISQIL